MNKILIFLKSFWFHVWAGFPKAPQAEIDRRYKICQACHLFKDNKCLECGCGISNKKRFLNKAAWLDQECPIKKW